MREVRLEPGERYGRLTVERTSDVIVNRTAKRPAGRRTVIVRCTCGRRGILVSIADLRAGNKVSCGCARLDRDEDDPEPPPPHRGRRQFLTPSEIVEADEAYYAAHPTERDE